MEISDPKVEIASLPFDERGERIEPEAQPAKIVQSGNAPMTVGFGETIGSLPMRIENHLTAGALAATVRDPCGTCKYFARGAWTMIVKKLRSSYEGRQRLNSIMAELLATENISVEEMHAGADGDFDTDHAVNSLGLCRILSEIHADDVIVHPLGVCPPEMRSALKPRGAYVARESDYEKSGAVAYDAVLRAAEGKR